MSLPFTTGQIPTANDFNTLLVKTGDTMSGPLAMAMTTNAPAQKITNTGPSFSEYSRNAFAAKGSVGALGSGEMNLSSNMDYTTGIHRLYDQTQAAHWIAISPSGLFLQYAPATAAAGDVWDAGGNLYNLSIDVNGNWTTRGVVQPLGIVTASGGTTLMPTLGKGVFSSNGFDGAKLYGFGSAGGGDVTLANRSGTAVVVVGPNNTNTQMMGPTSINGKTPISNVSAPPAAGATFTAAEQTLLNDIRTRLINFGIYT